MTFRKVATIEDLWAGEMMPVECAGLCVLLVNLNDKVYAYEDACPHLGTALSEGSLQGKTLTCSTHGWQFDASNGRGINPQTARLKSIPVQLENEDILVEVADATLQGEQ
jgi:toluene monooxygenase system ferredoxin subunit